MEILRQRSPVMETVPLVPFCRSGTKLMSSRSSLPAALDVILKKDGKNEQSDCEISWLSVSASLKAQEELQGDYAFARISVTSRVVIINSKQTKASAFKCCRSDINSCASGEVSSVFPVFEGSRNISPRAPWTTIAFSLVCLWNPWFKPICDSSGLHRYWTDPIH